MMFHVTIECANASQVTILTTEPERAYKFVRDFDHEGASVTMNVQLQNSEETYHTLSRLVEAERHSNPTT